MDPFACLKMKEYYDRGRQTDRQTSRFVENQWNHKHLSRVIIQLGLWTNFYLEFCNQLQIIAYVLLSFYIHISSFFQKLYLSYNCKRGYPLLMLRFHRIWFDVCCDFKVIRSHTPFFVLMGTKLANESTLVPLSLFSDWQNSDTKDWCNLTQRNHDENMTLIECNILQGTRQSIKVCILHGPVWTSSVLWTSHNFSWPLFFNLSVMSTEGQRICCPHQKQFHILQSLKLFIPFWYHPFNTQVTPALGSTTAHCTT
jgi:hypothetical protein